MNVKASVSIALLSAVVLFGAAAPAAAGVVIDLPLDNSTADTSGNGNNATVIGTEAYAPIDVTTGFSFDGATYLSAPANPSLAIPQGGVFVLSALVDAAADNLASERIVDSITVGTGDGYLLDIVDGHFRTIVGNTILYDPNLVQAGTTYQVVVLYNAAAGAPTLSLFVNGTYDVTSSAGAFPTGVQNFRVGGDSNGANLFKGVIANVAVGFIAVPEPETWTMMILGLGLIGAAQRRRSRVASPPPVY